MSKVSVAREKACAKYLAHYAEPEVQALASFPSTLYYQHAVVIPAFQETGDFIDRFVHSVLAQQACLLIVIINQPDSGLSLQQQQAQVDLSAYIKQQGETRWQHNNLYLVELNSVEQQSNSAILLVDRYNVPIPVEQGVGLARKIGADLALKLYHQGQISSSWLHSTDADAHLPDNYLSAYGQANPLLDKAVVTCCNFYHYSRHLAIHDANMRYENALRYYVAGLQYAQSPSAYFTIGSTLSFDVFAYSQARGFPKRSAGEDFYLLNKLAKLGEVAFLSDVLIKLDARPSQRVPFGTGPAVQNIMHLAQTGADYYYYHPQVFTALRTCLQAFEHLWQQRHQPELWLSELPDYIQQALSAVGLMAFINKQKNAKQQQFNKQLVVWFDSFKTLKFIHAVRDLGLANIPLEQAIATAPFSIDHLR
ncbi:hypothetical protein SAMN05216262_103198 [Colwellia chukchiensis]|uniref:Glycosyl transferase family 2 n=1 Tax=Colwellia chukchiensis TaxID=641665 RepID=A0A1H7KNI9_9GAMM|nr:hypothetical protein [Colwellia chukchiensis]SEK88096.1 hypothetical protein SAMN05216262_103198 [Colwellia chukchiensis]